MGNKSSTLKKINKIRNLRERMIEKAKICGFDKDKLEEMELVDFVDKIREEVIVYREEVRNLGLSCKRLLEQIDENMKPMIKPLEYKVEQEIL